jgi:hypothetical protein
LLRLIEARHPRLTVPPVPVSLSVGGALGEGTADESLSSPSGLNTGAKPPQDRRPAHDIGTMRLHTCRRRPLCSRRLRRYRRRAYRHSLSFEQHLRRWRTTTAALLLDEPVGMIH